MVLYKKAKHAIDVANSKKSSIEKSPQSYLNASPIFSFRKYDGNTPWAISNKRQSTDRVFINLRGLEFTTWGEIMQASGGKSHGTNSHHIRVEELSRAARQRANDIELAESELFSLRLQGTVRLWGIIEPENGWFYVIWFDPDHEVYPAN